MLGLSSPPPTAGNFIGRPRIARLPIRRVHACCIPLAALITAYALFAGAFNRAEPDIMTAAAILDCPVPTAVSLPSATPAAGASAWDAVLILGHGASGDLSTGHLPMWAQKSAEAGVPCIRYTAKGTQLAGRVKTIAAVLECARASPLFANTKRWIFGGHSMGGRVACEAASQLASSDPGALGGVLLFSYPLHPPGNPTTLRDEPPLALSTPLLIIKGSKDPFSTPEPWNTFVDKLPKSSAEIVTLEGGDHSLKTAKVAGGKGGDSPAGVATAVEEVAQAVQAFLKRVARAPDVASKATSAERKLRSKARAEAAASGVGGEEDGAMVREAGAKKGANEGPLADDPGVKKRRAGGKKEKTAPVERSPPAPVERSPPAPQAASENRVARRSRAAKKPLEKKAAVRKSASKRVEPPSKGPAA